jgi:hypothetical protein
VPLEPIATGSTGFASWWPALGASAVTWALAGWTPSAGLAGQTFSIIARLGSAYILDIMLWCFILGLERGEIWGTRIRGIEI